MNLKCCTSILVQSIIVDSVTSCPLLITHYYMYWFKYNTVVLCCWTRPTFSILPNIFLPHTLSFFSLHTLTFASNYWGLTALHFLWKTKFVLIKYSHAPPPPHQHIGQTLISLLFEVTEEIWIIVWLIPLCSSSTSPRRLYLGREEGEKSWDMSCSSQQRLTCEQLAHLHAPTHTHKPTNYFWSVAALC